MNRSKHRDSRTIPRTSLGDSRTTLCSPDIRQHPQLSPGGAWGIRGAVSHEQPTATPHDVTKNGRAKILEIGPYPPPYDGWSMRIWVLKKGLEEAGHVCVPLNLGLNRKRPS